MPTNSTFRPGYDYDAAYLRGEITVLEHEAWERWDGARPRLLGMAWEEARWFWLVVLVLGSLPVLWDLWCGRLQGVPSA